MKKENLIPINLISEGEKKNLVEKIYREKSSRADSSSAPSLYISLPKPDLSISDITNGVLIELSKSPTVSKAWSESWGRVLVGVSPTSSESFKLQKQGPETKSFVALQTTTLIRPSDVLGKDTGGKNIILINDQPVSTEGLVVEITHLIDELIFTKSQNSTYCDAIRNVISEGIQVIPCSENDILSMKKDLNEKVTVRLYGSMAIKSIPKVIGAVMQVEDYPKEAIILEEKPLIEELKKTKEKTEISGPISFGLGITLGKPLHIGHLMNITAAELGRESTSGAEVRIFSNDTAPRLAGMIVSLSEKYATTPNEICRLLRLESIPEADIITAYRSRDQAVNNSAYAEAEEEIQNGGGILSVLEKAASQSLLVSGFLNIRLKRESELQDISRQVISSLAADWAGTGFAIAKLNNNLSVLEKGGQITSTTKITAFLLDALTSLEGICLVDSEASSHASSEIVQYIGGNVDQMSGVGVGVNGELGSGTTGNLPEVSRLVDLFGDSLKEVLLYYSLTNPLTSSSRPNGRNTNTFYDFASAELIEKNLGLSFLSLQNFKDDLSKLLDDLDDENIFTSDNSSFEVSQKVAQLSVIPPTSQIINSFRRLEVISEDQSINAIVEKYKNKWVGNLKQDIYSLIIHKGVKNNQDLARVMQEKGSQTSLVTPPSKIMPLCSRYTSAVLSQGYSGERAVRQAKKYQEGSLFLLRRQNLYWNKILSIMKLSSDKQNLSTLDAKLVKKILISSIAKVGIKI